MRGKLGKNVQKFQMNIPFEIGLLLASPFGRLFKNGSKFYPKTVKFTLIQINWNGLTMKSKACDHCVVCCCLSCYKMCAHRKEKISCHINYSKLWFSHFLANLCLSNEIYICSMWHSALATRAHKRNLFFWCSSKYIHIYVCSAPKISSENCKLKMVTKIIFDPNIWLNRLFAAFSDELIGLQFEIFKMKISERNFDISYAVCRMPYSTCTFGINCMRFVWGNQRPVKMVVESFEGITIFYFIFIFPSSNKRKWALWFCHGCLLSPICQWLLSCLLAI